MANNQRNRELYSEFIYSSLLKTNNWYEINTKTNNIINEYFIAITVLQSLTINQSYLRWGTPLRVRYDYQNIHYFPIESFFEKYMAFNKKLSSLLKLKLDNGIWYWSVWKSVQVKRVCCQ